MKNLKLTLILCLFSSALAFGQNYQTVISNRISYFENHSKSINCIRIDSAIYSSDSTLYPFSNRQTEDGCMTPFGDSWIGGKIIKKENGLNIFFNRDHDSIQIKTNASLNDSWTAYFIPDSIKIIATVISHDTMSFLGQQDSVKTIAFQVYDKNMNLLDYPLNNMEIRISENFGFVETLNFYSFPNINNGWEEYSLIGISNPKIGIQNLTWFEIYDFQPGDELHIVSESYDDVLQTQISDKIIRKYLSRSDYNDSIVYTYSQKESYTRTNPDTSIFYIYEDVIKKELIKSDPEFDKLPGEPARGGSTYFIMVNNPVLSKYYSNSIYPAYDSCWEVTENGDDNSISYEYLKGLGGLYYKYVTYRYIEETKLVYYKKGDVSWGTPVVITALPDRPDQEDILVFPNPAHDQLTILINKFDQTKIFELLDITGRVIVKENIVSRQSNIGIQDLKPGTYVYRIRNDKEIVKMDKLVIQ